MGKKNPLLLKKYKEGFDTGFEEAKVTSIAHFTVRAERLPEIKGIGAKLKKQIEDALFHTDLTPEEWQKAEDYYHELKEQNRKGKEQGKWKR